MSENNGLNGCKIIEETDNITVQECKSGDFNVTILTGKLKEGFSNKDLKKIKDNADELGITVFEQNPDSNELK